MIVFSSVGPWAYGVVAAGGLLWAKSRDRSPEGFGKSLSTGKVSFDRLAHLILFLC